MLFSKNERGIICERSLRFFLVIIIEYLDTHSCCAAIILLFATKVGAHAEQELVTAVPFGGPLYQISPVLSDL